MIFSLGQAGEICGGFLRPCGKVVADALQWNSWTCPGSVRAVWEEFQEWNYGRSAEICPEGGRNSRIQQHIGGFPQLKTWYWFVTNWHVFLEIYKDLYFEFFWIYRYFREVEICEIYGIIPKQKDTVSASDSMCAGAHRIMVYYRMKWTPIPPNGEIPVNDIPQFNLPTINGTKSFISTEQRERTR